MLQTDLLEEPTAKRFPRVFGFQPLLRFLKSVHLADPHLVFDLSQYKFQLLDI